MQQERQQNNPDRVPPQDIKAEQSVLGAMLINKEAVSEVAEMLNPEDFTGRRTGSSSRPCWRCTDAMRPSTSSP